MQLTVNKELRMSHRSGQSIPRGESTVEVVSCFAVQYSWVKSSQLRGEVHDLFVFHNVFFVVNNLILKLIYVFFN